MAGSLPGASGRASRRTRQEATVRVTTSTPAKAILIGEHAVNRGATALAVSVGLRARCTLFASETSRLGADEILLVDGDRHELTTRAALLALSDEVDDLLARQEYNTIQSLAAADYFAPAKYVLASAGSVLPRLVVEFHSAIPRSAGLGSGGAAFVALAAALDRVIGGGAGPRELAQRSRRGDLIAHGGVASGLDTQTSLYGGALRYTAACEAEPVPVPPGLLLVIGNSGVSAATSAVNGGVRAWLAERPLREHYFAEIGLLARHAEEALRIGDWPELGRLLNLNQLVLERIGVSCPELEVLNEAALEAGAYGAKLSGSGGGGIMIALVAPERTVLVAEAITGAGGTAIVAPVGVPGVTVCVEE